MALSGNMVGEMASLLVCLYGIIDRYKNLLFDTIWVYLIGIPNSLSHLFISRFSQGL